MRQPLQREKPSTVRALDRAWGGDPKNGFAGASPEWDALAPSTKKNWAHQRRQIVAVWGDLEVPGIAPKHVLALRDKLAAKPGAANNLMRCLSSMLGWSVPREWRRDNPCREVKPLKGGDGYAPWPIEVIDAAERELKQRGRQDLWWAIALALYTGQRLNDCLTMKWSAVADGYVYVKQGKTGKELFIRTHRNLEAVLDTIPRRGDTILTSTKGRPWKGFHASWQKYRPTLAHSHGLVFHGLRKSAVVMLLEAGATEAETAAVTGQSLAMVAHYAKQVNQRHLASAAVLKWEASEPRTERDIGNPDGKPEPENHLSP